jgi:DnaJ-class molecular chaperone
MSDEDEERIARLEAQVAALLQAMDARACPYCHGDGHAYRSEKTCSDCRGAGVRIVHRSEVP